MARPSGKGEGKRKAAPPALKPSKRAKSAKAARTQAAAAKSVPKSAPKESLLGANGRPKRKADQPKKVKLKDQKVIPVPKTQFDVARKRRRADEDEDDDEEAGSDDGDEDDDVDDDDDLGGDLMDLGEEDGLDAQFLLGMDRNALSRSTNETRRLHKISKKTEVMPEKPRTKLRLPSPGSASTMSDYDINTDDELPSDDEGDSDDLDDGEEEGSGMDDDLYDEDNDEEDVAESSEDEDQDDIVNGFDELPDESDDDEARRKRKGKKKEEEADYERSGRSRWAEDSGDEEERNEVEVGRLPIKLPTGEVQQVEGTTKIALPATKKRKQPEPIKKEEVSENESDDEEDQEGAAVKMAAQKGRFGRMGVAEIVAQDGWKNARKLEAAKEQIAALGAEILAGGELIDTIPTLTRLSTFSLPSVTSPSSTTPLPVPNSVRGLALLSQLAVYKDLVPGYRIRQLTEQEEAEKVRDEVRRLREGEKGLVRTYKAYLKTLETEIRKRSALASLSIRCYCDLLASIPHFNFSENIMGILVGKLGRRSWDDDSEQILQTFISVFQADLTSTYSQTLVRLIARMTKERKFQIHPNVLSCLLHLRLVGELDKMRDGKNSKGRRNDRDGKGKDKKEAGGIKIKQFKSETRKKWATKNQRKREKELKEIDKELKEAEAEVDVEERAQVQTETLKNLFVLYFSILKYQQRTPLLPAALEGITHFGHFINIEFFRDLLAVLRRIVLDEHEQQLQSNGDDEAEGEEGDAEEKYRDSIGESERIRTRLLAIATAFEILSGQGEALNIDLSEFINALFGLLRPLCLDTGIDDPPSSASLSAASAKSAKPRPLVAGRPPPPSKSTPLSTLPTSELLLRCLHSIFFSKHATNPPWRTAAFIKRLSECALHFPPRFAKTVLELAANLMSRDAKFEGLVDTEERMFDGTYKPELDDPQLVNTFTTSLWEVLMLENKYYEKEVKAQAKKLGLGNANANGDQRKM